MPIIERVVDFMKACPAAPQERRKVFGGSAQMPSVHAILTQVVDFKEACPSAPQERRRVWSRHCAKLRAEAAFARLLDETPGLSADTPWPLVKRQVPWAPNLSAYFGAGLSCQQALAARSAHCVPVSPTLAHYEALRPQAQRSALCQQP